MLHPPSPLPPLQRDIYTNSRLLVELCAVKLQHDWFVLLELLAIVLNPSSKSVEILLFRSTM